MLIRNVFLFSHMKVNISRWTSPKKGNGIILQDAILVHHFHYLYHKSGKTIFYGSYQGSKFKYVIEGVWKTQNSDLENSNLETSDLTSKMRLKSIAPLQMEKRSIVNLTVGENAKPSAYVSSCFSSVLSACCSRARYRLFYLLLDNASLVLQVFA